MFRSSPNPNLDPPIHSRFILVYDTLPDSAKRALLEDHLLPLIDSLPSTSKRTLLSTAHALQTRFTHLPPLSLSSKKAEINVLLEELRLDSYRPPASSRREEISEEIVDSLVDWLSDIWQTVYEVGVEFESGHQCLLYCCEVLQQISAIVSGCKCSFINVDVSTSILDRSGSIVKEFSYPNVNLLEDAFLWIWRDMLLRILADGRKSELEAIPRMLREIQSAMREWETALDRLLVAGTMYSRSNGNERHMDNHGDYYDDGYTGSRCPVSNSKYCHHCPNNATHWPPSIHDQLPNLRTYISTVLYEYFTLHPSIYLYITIISLTPASRRSLLDHLRSTAPHSAAAAAAALYIHVFDRDATSLLATLSAARPVLRARDAPALQRAARFLMKTSARAHIHTVCHLVERELLTCVNSIRGALLSRGFEGLENEQGTLLWGAVALCAVGSAQRTEAVRRWVDAVATTGQPGAGPGPELNFAALLMGFPLGFEPDDPDPDPFLFSTITEGHPDYEDLHEEWRPRLRERFEGWIGVAKTLKNLGNKGGNGSGMGMELMSRIAAEMVEQMPWVGQEDVVHEMIGRIQDNPTKHHICDALYGLLEFMIDQKNWEERRRKTAMSSKVRTVAENSSQAAEGSNGAGNSHGGGGSTLSGDTQSISGGSVSGTAPAVENKTGGKEKGRSKGKESEQHPYPPTVELKYTAKGKGKGKALYQDMSSTEGETERVRSDNRETPGDPHASGSELTESVGNVYNLGQENGLDGWSRAEAQIQAGTYLGSAAEGSARWSSSLSDASLPELVPIDALD